MHSLLAYRGLLGLPSKGRLAIQLRRRVLVCQVDDWRRVLLDSCDYDRRALPLMIIIILLNLLPESRILLLPEQILGRPDVGILSSLAILGLAASVGAFSGL